MRSKILKKQKKIDIFGKSLACDFVGGPVNHRLRFGGGRGQDLARAAGLKPGVNHILLMLRPGWVMTHLLADRGGNIN